MLQNLNGVLQILVIVGAAVVSYFHYRLEHRFSEFKNDLFKELRKEFTSKDVAGLQFQVLSTKLDGFLARVELLERGSGSRF